MSEIKLNCWEVKKCGREPDGINADELGVCPAAIDTSGNAINQGKNGGRICWAVAGTFCDGETQGTYADKFDSCVTCSFFIKVEHEEGKQFKKLKPGQKFGDILKISNKDNSI